LAGKSSRRDFFRLKDQVQFVALCDVDANRLAKTKGTVDVYSEKPTCRTLEDGKTIVSAVKKNNNIWQTGSWQRSQEHFRRGAELAINGRAGKIKLIEMRVANSSRFTMGMGATWIGDLGWIHVDRGGKLMASDPKILEEKIGDKEIHLYKSTNHYQNFIDSVRSRKPALAPVEVAYRAISAGLLGEIAMTTGQKIKWDPEKEEIIGNTVATRLMSRPYRQYLL
jgi:hypothetical protein